MNPATEAVARADTAAAVVELLLVRPAKARVEEALEALCAVRAELEARQTITATHPVAVEALHWAIVACEERIELAEQAVTEREAVLAEAKVDREAVRRHLMRGAA